MEVYHQIQYQALTEPVPLEPSDQVNPVWFPQWMYPTQQVNPVEYRYLFQSVFFVGEPSDFIVTAVPDFGWYRPADEPVLPETADHLLGSIDFVNVPSLQVNPVWFPQWMQPIDQAVLPIEFRYQLESYFDPANWQTAIATDSGVDFPSWMSPIQQPVLPIEYRHLIPDFFVQINPDDFPTGSTPPTAQPLSVFIASATANNRLTAQNSANSITAIKSKNSVTPV